MSKRTETLQEQLKKSSKEDRVKKAALAARPLLERTDRETEGKRNLIQQLLAELNSKEQTALAETDGNRKYFLETVRMILNTITDGHMNIIDNEKGYGVFLTEFEENGLYLTYSNPNTVTSAPASGLPETKPEPRTLVLKAKIGQAPYGSNLVIFIYDLERNTITVEQPDISTVFKQTV